MTSILWPDPKDISPLERKSRLDMADKLAQIARLELAVKVLGDALREIKTHHTLQNLSRGRPLEHSHTLNQATVALKRAAAYLNEPP